MVMITMETLVLKNLTSVINSIRGRSAAGLLLSLFIGLFTISLINVDFDSKNTKIPLATLPVSPVLKTSVLTRWHSRPAHRSWTEKKKKKKEKRGKKRPS